MSQAHYIKIFKDLKNDENSRYKHDLKKLSNELNMKESVVIDKCIELIERVSNDKNILQITSKMQKTSLNETDLSNNYDYSETLILKHLYDDKNRQLFGKYNNFFDSMDDAMTFMLQKEPYKKLEPYLSIFDADYLANADHDTIIQDMPSHDNSRSLSRKFLNELFFETIIVDKELKSIFLGDGKCKSSKKKRVKRNEIPIDFVMQWSKTYVGIEKIYYLNISNNSLAKEDLKFLEKLEVEILNVSGNRILFDIDTDFHDTFISVIKNVKSYVDFSNNLIDYDVDILNSVYLQEGLAEKYVWLNSGHLDSKHHSNPWVKFYKDNNLSEKVDIVFKSHCQYFSTISAIEN
eukprot:NODE_17_length_41373_cov_0.337016.p13 type:complete len:349 gc:universal NODE_17_length_41373_cov_0.337016:13408-14454(+)